MLDALNLIHEHFAQNRNQKIRLRNIELNNNPEITDSKLWKLLFNSILSMGTEHFLDMADDDDEREIVGLQSMGQTIKLKKDDG